MVSRSALSSVSVWIDLDRSLAEGALAHDQRASVILQRSSHDFGRRGAADIDQHDDRQAMGHVARLRIITLDIVLLAAALRHDLAVVEEGVD